MNASVWRRARVQRNLVDADLTTGLCDVVSRYGLCPNGYEVTSRQVVIRYQSPFGSPVDDIGYRGRCEA